MCARSNPCTVGPPMFAPCELFLLRRAPYKVSLVSKKNFNLCCPLKHRVAVNTLVGLAGIWPRIARHNCQVIAAVLAIDLQRTAKGCDAKDCWNVERCLVKYSQVPLKRWMILVGFYLTSLVACYKLCKQTLKILTREF